MNRSSEDPQDSSEPNDPDSSDESDDGGTLGFGAGALPAGGGGLDPRTTVGWRTRGFGGGGLDPRTTVGWRTRPPPTSSESVDRSEDSLELSLGCLAF